MRRALTLLAALLLAGCDGNLGGLMPGAGGGRGGAGGGASAMDGGDCTPVGRNDEVRLALAPACAGCHSTGNKPYFASLASFENGLAYDVTWVNPQDPEGSGLIRLLRGTATGAYPQMPPGESYASLLASGRARLTIDEVKAWIAALPPRGAVNQGPAPGLFTVRRLRADEMILSLLDQLGLGPEDFVSTGDPDWRDREWTVNGGKLFVWPTDWAPGISHQYVSDARATERYETLGGAVALQGRKKDAALGPSSLQTLVQMSQAWCRRAVEKQGNTAILRSVTLVDKSSTNAAGIRQNLGQLWLRMLGEPPSDDDLDELYTHVYLPLEATDTRTAWTGVCAALVRNPKWLSY